VLALGVLTFFVYHGVKFISRFYRKPSAKKGITLKRAYFFASVLALAPVMLIGMKSIGRANVYEVVLVILFEAVACFYIVRQR
jgi:hypothetical protein